MAAEPVVSAHVDGRRRMWRGSSCGPALIQCSARAMCVEVLDVLAQTMSRWRGPVIKEVVEAFPAQGADDPFCDRLARGRPDRVVRGWRRRTAEGKTIREIKRCLKR